MNLKKYIVEIGMGIDQHGQDSTNAAQKAVKDAISRSCLCGLLEIAKLSEANRMFVEVLVACPNPGTVNEEKVLQAIPFGQKQVKVIEGGMVAKSIYQPELGDTSNEVFVANAAVTVSVDMDEVLEAWKAS